MMCGSYPLASSTTTGSVIPQPTQRYSGLNHELIDQAIQSENSSVRRLTLNIIGGGTAMHPELTEKDKQKCRKPINKLYIIKNKNSNDY